MLIKDGYSFLPRKFSLTAYTYLLKNGSKILWAYGNTNIKNTYAALIVPNLLMGAFYVIMMRTYFNQNIPEEVLEAARIDGAGEWYILGRIVVPLSKPIIATLSLLIGFEYWNDWINGLYYLNKDHYYTIQVLLNQMLTDMAFLSSNKTVVVSNIDTNFMQN